MFVINFYLIFKVLADYECENNYYIDSFLPPLGICLNIRISVTFNGLGILIRYNL